MSRIIGGSAPDAVSSAWPDSVEAILGGDQVLVFAHVTPMRGVVLTPLTNTGLRDREAGVVTPVTSSVGMWRKLAAVARNPNVAVAYHTRQHGFCDRPEYVLLQGRASLSDLADRGWLERHRDNWERFSGPRDVGPGWERWLRIYHWRVAIELAVKRLMVWPDRDCRGDTGVYGAPAPAEPPGRQRQPRRGTEPRINHPRAARRARRLANVLLGWVGADGFPVVVPVRVAGTAEHGILLNVPPGAVPAGGRRAGLTAHSFARYTFGQHQRKHTGWLEAEPGASRVIYAPHTESGYWLPKSRLLYRAGAGLVTRRGYRRGRRAGFLP